MHPNVLAICNWRYARSTNKRLVIVIQLIILGFLKHLMRYKQGVQGDMLHSSTTAQLSRLRPNSTSSSGIPAVKVPQIDHGINQEKSPTTTCAEAFTSKYESTNMKSTEISDQKTLKVRIKMGTDNLSTQKNAAIYSGLGLDVSPSSSSSLDESPSESEGISREHQGAPFESPSSIIQVNCLLAT